MKKVGKKHIKEDLKEESQIIKAAKKMQREDKRVLKKGK